MMQPIDFILTNLLLALTELQVDELIRILRSIIETSGEGIKTLWVTLSPVLLGYLAYRQAANRKEIAGKIADNTDISVKAFDAANGHNEKIAAAVEISKEVISAIKDKKP
jgi:hypothetical protein